MSDTPNLALPLILAAQAQKHVTHNEALAILDAIVQLSVEGFDAIELPGSADDGQVWALGSDPTGAWDGQEGMLAARISGGWVFVTPRMGWRAASASDLRVFTGAGWEAPALASAAFGAATHARVLTEEISGLTGPSVNSAIQIPDRAIVLAVSTRTSGQITGADSYDCGISGEPAKFGGSLGVAAGASNIGVIGPQAFYSDTPIMLTANGGDFTGGSVRLAIHLLEFTGPAA